MPTMTKQTLDRRLNRHSLDNQIDDIAANGRGQMRYSLTSAENKENYGVHFLHSPFGNNSLIALHDLSNGKSPRRTETPTSLRRRTLSSLTMTMDSGQIKQINAAKNLLNDKKVNSLTGSIEIFTENYNTENENHCRKCYDANQMPEESLSSSHMGDDTLDLVLDAIIESARKDVRKVCRRTIEQMNYDFQRPLIPETRSVTPLYEVADFAETSIHEMEVCTPPHLKRQRVVRRKNPKTAKKQKDNKKNQLVPHNSTNLNETCNLTKTEGTLLKSDECKPNSFSYEEKSDKFQVERSPTPSLEEAQSIKRCLSFSSDDDVDFSAAKRSSVASSNASSMNGEFFNFNSGRSSRSSRSSLRGDPKGSLELDTQIRDNILNVHVIRCRDLQRASGSTVLNAYVKVAIISNKKKDSLKNMDNGFQRTAVHRHSSRPIFDHWFKFDLIKTFDNLTNFDNDDRLQLAVWHRDRQLKRSEFLGCLSFQLPTLLQQAINGAYKLQSQACLNNPQPPVPIIITTTTATATAVVQNTQRNQILATDKTITTSSTLPSLTPPNLNSASKTQQLQLLKPNNLLKMTTNVVTKQHQSDEDIESIEDGTAQAVEIDALEAGGMQQPMILSKKALHQRDADENLFLRFLELDPLPTDPVPEKNNNKTSNSVHNTPNNNSKDARRLSNTPSVPPIGRTPFTITKRLTRTAERGFGFSIVWTHPPRVEKVELGLSADRKGIMPGDYVIFVDKHNVVTMPEPDVLNLIRAQGSSLTLEIFRRQCVGPAGSTSMVPPALSFSGRSNATTMAINGKTAAPIVVEASMPQGSQYASDDVLTVTAAVTTPTMITARRQSATNQQPARPATVCSNSSSMEAAKRRLNLPQVTFSKESIMPISDNRRRFLLQLISREQNFICAIHFGIQRFVQPLQERKDIISPNDHRTLFQNMDELLRISEDILEQLSNDGQEPQMNFASRVYLSKTTAICAAYKKYLNGIKRADCVLVNKSRQAGSDFVAFITEPPVPRKRPDLTMFIHRPLQHFREILKLMQMLSTNCHLDTEEYKNFNSVINELQAAYREITISSGLMEPLGEGRPLLTLQDLESRMVFTKCKPFTLAVQGRQWIFGGDLSRVEGRSVKPYWALLFSDIIVFAKVSRDRVLFITEEPVPIANIVDSCFNMRKKTTEFRLTVDPNGRLAESPTGYCAPDLSRTPKKGLRRKNLMLRAPSLELKAVWQNLLQRQIFLVNAALGSTPLSSPLDSPDVLNTLVPLSDIGYASASIGSIKLPSMDSINLRNQQHHQSHQVRLLHQRTICSDNSTSYENLQRLASALATSHISTRLSQTTQDANSNSQKNSPARTHSPCLLVSGGQITDSSHSLRLLLGRRQLFETKTLGTSRAVNYNLANNSSSWLSLSGSSLNTQTHCSGENLTACKCLTAIPETVGESMPDGNGEKKVFQLEIDTKNQIYANRVHNCTNNKSSVEKCGENLVNCKPSKLVDFSLSSVGRSFIDEAAVGRYNRTPNFSLNTPDTPTLNISPTCKSETFSNDFVLEKPQTTSKLEFYESNVPLAEFEGSWDLLELDLNLHEVNLDPCYDTDCEEFIFHGDDKNPANSDNDDDLEDQIDIELVVDDPFGILPTRPTPPDSLDL